MLNKELEPSEKDIFTYLGNDAKEAWIDVISFLRTNYDFLPEINYGGFPEKGAFTILIVLGKKEVEQFEEHINKFSSGCVELFKSVRQFYDGRWLWIRVLNKSDTADIKRLLIIKRKPSNK